MLNTMHREDKAMESLVKEIGLVFGSSALFVILAAWLIKIVLIEALKRESAQLSSELHHQANVSLQELKQQGELELATRRQQLDIELKSLTDLRTEFMAEQAISRLLTCPGWELRTFDAIEERIAGFPPDELRRLLVRSGAVRFRRRSDNVEMWGLLSRNPLPSDTAP
jgi:hypothetical protein